MPNAGDQKFQLGGLQLEKEIEVAIREEDLLQQFNEFVLVHLNETVFLYEAFLLTPAPSGPFKKMALIRCGVSRCQPGRRPTNPL